jgi:hypothetical protein
MESGGIIQCIVISVPNVGEKLVSRSGSPVSGKEPTEKFCQAALLQFHILPSYFDIIIQAVGLLSYIIPGPKRK